MKGLTAEGAEAGHSKPALGVGEVGRASPGLASRAARPGTILLRVRVWVIYPRDGLLVSLALPPFYSVLPKPPGHSPGQPSPAVRALGSLMGAPCGQASQPLGRGPDRGPGERAQEELGPDHWVAALPWDCQMWWARGRGHCRLAS